MMLVMSLLRLRQIFKIDMIKNNERDLMKERVTKTELRYKEIMGKLDFIENNISNSYDKLTIRIANIEDVLRKSDKNQTHIQIKSVLITLSITYLILGLTVLFSLIRELATVEVVIVCFALCALFIVLGFTLPKWLFK